MVDLFFQVFLLCLTLIGLFELSSLFFSFGSAIFSFGGGLFGLCLALFNRGILFDRCFVFVCFRLVSYSLDLCLLFGLVRFIFRLRSGLVSLIFSFFGVFFCLIGLIELVHRFFVCFFLNLGFLFIGFGLLLLQSLFDVLLRFLFILDLLIQIFQLLLLFGLRLLGFFFGLFIDFFLDSFGFF